MIATLEYGKSLRDYRTEAGRYLVYGTNGPIGWYDESLCMHPGVIVGRKGAYRGIHYSPEPFFVIDTAFYLEPKQEMDLRWAYYCLLTYDINGMDSGSAIPSTSREAFYRLPVLVPPLKEQQAISCILGALDDKIELNRRINRTLEAMAWAIFKSWFVDFDPVRAKVDGLDPGMPKPVADLFPDSFEDSALGNIPKGWKIFNLPDLIEINPTRRLAKGTKAPYLDMASMPTEGHCPESWIERDFGSGMRFMNGDTLVARITPCLENGKTAYVDFLKDNEIGWGSTEYIVLMPHEPIPTVFAYLLARSSDFRSFAIQRMTGSSGRQRVPADSLATYQLASPALDSNIFEAFGKAVNPYFMRIHFSMGETRILKDLRDSLLPKLISGDLRISNAERIVERCV
ncbi:MAG: restriction endonuclease subunit S [Verrucomicrobiota bacterium]